MTGDQKPADCIEPSYVNLDPKLPEEAEVIVSGQIIASAPGNVRCVPANTTSKCRKLLHGSAALPRRVIVKAIML
jgi:hypothetical protein